MNEPVEANLDGAPLEKLLAEYERAQDVAQHADSITYEVASIVWGANTLLLGFILEVPCDADRQPIVILAAIIGILITCFVPIVVHLVKIGQLIAFDICREIEGIADLTRRLHTRIHAKYPRGSGRAAIGVITAFFLIAWAVVICHSYHCMHPINRTPLSDGGCPLF